MKLLLIENVKLAVKFAYFKRIDERELHVSNKDIAISKNFFISLFYMIKLFQCYDMNIR